MKIHNLKFNLIALIFGVLFTTSMADTTSLSALPDTTLEIQIDKVKKDTILVITSSSLKDVVDKTVETVRDSRQRGIGGCAGFSTGIIWLDMKPIHDVLDAELQKMNISLPTGYAPLTVFGGTGYAGLGNGIRIGGSGYGGSKSFSSVKIDSTQISGQNDTTITIRTSIGYGGLLIEKALVASRFNFILGGCIGAGGIGISLQKQLKSSVFSTLPRDSFDISKGISGIGAPFLLAELHGGFTYSLVSWMHIGFVAAAPVAFSSNGFIAADGNNLGEGFISVNPSIQLRFILGNIG